MMHCRYPGWALTLCYACSRIPRFSLDFKRGLHNLSAGLYTRDARDSEGCGRQMRGDLVKAAKTSAFAPGAVSSRHVAQ